MTPESAGPRLPPLREVIRRHGIAARKGLGQHFLLDLNLTGRIARSAGDLSQGTIIEVGPGPGGLTRALLAHGAQRLVAIEKDERCVRALEELAEAHPGKLEIVAGDALKVAPRTFGPGPRRIVANLPYNIATALLVRWLKDIADDPQALSGVTVMVQKEVAQRLAAESGTGAYGRLSVLAQWLCEVRLAFDVPARAFTPPPKVTSSVVVLTPLPLPRAPADLAALERLTAAVFGQRRKMLRQSLKQLTAEPGILLGAVGIAPTARPEELTVQELCALARALKGT